MVLSEQRFKSIRKKLDTLGYHQPLSFESGLLVDQLLSDIILCKEELEHYKQRTLNLEQKCDSLIHSVQPYKELNEKLVKENNVLHLKTIQVQEKAEFCIRELKSDIVKLENSYSDLEFLNNEYLSKNGELQKLLSIKEQQILELKGIRVGETEKQKRVQGKDSCSDKPKIQYSLGNCNNGCKFNESSGRLCEKTTETLKKLRIENCDLKEMMENYKEQIHRRDSEIKRLGIELQKKIPVTLSKCICHKVLDGNCSSDHFKTLENKLKDSQYKQHEAMFRAVCLADRINQLETKIVPRGHIQELKECKSEYMKELKLLKEQLQTCSMKIKNLEKTSMDLQKSNNELILEKDGIEIILSRLLEEKEKLKSQIMLLSSQGEASSTKEYETKCEIEDNGKKTGSVIYENINKMDKDRNSAKSKLEKQLSVKTTPLHDDHLRDEVIEQISAERNYYYNEYHKLKTRLSSFVEQNENMKQSYSKCPHAQLEQIIAEINSHNRESVQKISTHKKSDFCKEDEIAVLKSRLLELEDCLKNTRSAEIEGLRMELSEIKKIKNNLESNLRRCENEKSIQSAKHNDFTSEILYWKTQCEGFRQQIMSNANTLSSEKNRLELILNQTEMSLRNTEDSKRTLESELATAVDRIKSLENDKTLLEKKIESLEQDRNKSREVMLQLDQEKDSILFKLDLKTEHNSQLERELKEKESCLRKLNNTIINLEENVKRLKEVQKQNEESSRNLNKQIQQNFSLQQSKDALLRENSRLQQDLACKTQELEYVSIALENSKREAEELKDKLQCYVAEVQHVEELLQKKESERDNLLDHFRSLTIEASALETNNNSLESEAKTAKDVLKRSEDRVQKLEQMVFEKDKTMATMERQVDKLSQKVFSLETKISDLMNENLSREYDLKASRELCRGLEKQNQDFMAQLEEIRGGSYNRISTL